MMKMVSRWVMGAAVASLLILTIAPTGSTITVAPEDLLGGEDCCGGWHCHSWRNNHDGRGWYCTKWHYHAGLDAEIGA